MKHIFLLIFWCFTQTLFSQKETDCSPNAGFDQVICFDDEIILSAPSSDDYNAPPNITWTYLPGGPLPVSQVGFTNQGGLITGVTHIGINKWPAGNYTFQFCVDCADTNNDGQMDRLCAEVVVRVKAEPGDPVITEPDNTQDGMVTVCYSAIMGLSEPAQDEMATVTISPNDGDVTYTQVGNQLFLQREMTNIPYDGECTYKVIYSIEKDDCTKSTSVDVTFVNPYDPNGDGVIEGRIIACPSCTDLLKLRGDWPGCGGKGVWTLVSGPGPVTFSGVLTDIGWANATVTTNGTYTFQYTVSNADPCIITTPFTLTCSVLALDEFTLGPDKNIQVCSETMPAGTYPFSFNQIPNAIYEWKPGIPLTPGMSFSQPHNYFSDVILANPVNLKFYPISIIVRAYKFYIDPDCTGGPAEPYEVTLPYSDPNLNWDYLTQLQVSGDSCIHRCTTQSKITIMGTPVIQMPDDQLDFLCSNGTEVLVIGDYFEAPNATYSAYIYVTDHTSGTTIQVNNAPYVPGSSFWSTDQLKLIGPGDYDIMIRAVSNVNGVSCADTAYLKVRIRIPQPVDAGEDQVKCYNDPTRLNGTDSYQNGIQGTWSQVNCNPCTITFADPHDRNTQIFFTGITPANLPVDLFFEWTYSSEESTCKLADTVKVTVLPCRVPCDNLGLNIKTQCLEEKIVLTAFNSQGYEIDESIYQIQWTGSASEFPIINTNPVSVSNASPVSYTLEVWLNEGGVPTCYNTLSGVASCDTAPSGCGVRVIERCDECGNVEVFVIDEDGNPVQPAQYEHELRWVVYGNLLDPVGKVYTNENPIKVHPQACYSLQYDRYVYPENVPHVPGYHESICEFDLPVTCVSISCPGPCQDFPTFFIAGCGDDLDQLLNLTFPDGCHNVCGSVNGSSGTLGVFNSGNNPVTSGYHILWKNTDTGTYVTGNVADINYVLITGIGPDSCCFWEDRYEPNCTCTQEPTSVMCEQPIVKYCKPDGSVTYVPGIPRIAWTGVAGASSYLLEVTFGNPEGCCESAMTGTQLIPVSGSPWEIPIGWNCFTIRIKALNADGSCEESEWSYPYQYCPAEYVCSPVIIVCGCCHGRSDEAVALPVQVMGEEEMSAYLKEHPGTTYPTLAEALVAMGYQTPADAFVTVRPNPARNEITVLPGSRVRETETYTFEMIDALGHRVLRRVLAGTEPHTLDISALEAGVYTWRLFAGTDGKLLETGKMIVIL